MNAACYCLLFLFLSGLSGLSGLSVCVNLIFCCGTVDIVGYNNVETSKAVSVDE